jgi:hypothetical protein
LREQHWALLVQLFPDGKQAGGAAQSESVAFVHPDGQQPSPPAQVVIEVNTQPSALSHEPT